VIEKKTEGPKSHVLVFVVPNCGNFRMFDVAFGNLANNVSSSCFVTHALSSEKQQQFRSTFNILFNENVKLTLLTHCNVEMLMLELWMQLIFIFLSSGISNTHYSDDLPINSLITSRTYCESLTSCSRSRIMKTAPPSSRYTAYTVVTITSVIQCIVCYACSISCMFIYMH